MHPARSVDPIASVLIVEDSAVQRSHAAELCRAMGIRRVDEAGDGQAALDLLDTLPTPPTLMIVDLAMPRMDGIEFIEELQRRGSTVPVVIASSSGEALIETVLGMNSIVVVGLRKPLTLASLSKAFLDHAPRLCKPPERRQTARMPFDTPMLATALAEGAIQPHFQPQVDLRTLDVHGVEALARWHHPTLGYVPPDQFIPMAEREGLIHALTLGMLDRSLAHCAEWNRCGVTLTVSVNLSASLLVRPGIVGEICAQVAQHAVDPAQLMLELTESSFVESAGPALSALARLRLKGFGLSIDDYGTGFSSMQQLARIPFTELKVDRSFVHGASQRHGLRVILKSAIDLARQLGIATVAEGIETVEDLRLLQDFGCTSGQGWLIARPMPGDELVGWLVAHQDRLGALRAAPEPIA